MWKALFISSLTFMAAKIVFTCNLADFYIFDHAKNSNFEGMKKAVSEGANVNCVPNNPLAASESCALYEAAVRRNVVIVKFLLENNADPNLELSFDSATTLGSEKKTVFRAVFSRAKSIVRPELFKDIIVLLIKHGAKFDGQLKENLTEFLGYSPDTIERINKI